jgi:ATP-dependent exoDNAse (exonuclease V) alpha subunit
MPKIQVPQNFDYSRYPGGTSTLRFKDFVLRRLDKTFLEMDNPTPGIDLEGEQKAARDDVVDWLIHPDIDDRVLTIGGLAGCGKTVLATHIQAYIRALGLTCNVTSLTGQAVDVLRKKGIDRPETIHACLYTKDDNESKKQGRLVFVKNYFIDYEIIIIDEAQILSKQYYDDFLSFPHVRLIAIGDHGQLQAIGGETIDLMHNPRIKLEEPRRQALGSNILQFAHALRTGKQVRYGKCPGAMIAPRTMFWKDIIDPSYDKIIVGFNRTRHEVNKIVRRARGYHGDIPNIGEKVTCLYNHRDIGVFNGQHFIVDSVQPEGEELLRVGLDDNGRKYNVIAVRAQFGRDKIDLSYSNRFFREGYRDVVFLDFAYGSTAHKSMGSEYSRGKVLEECHRDTDLRRWSYTAVTRFVDQVDYYR